jgi:D-amino peptidase
MRVFIISDMEGVSGIARWDQVSTGGAFYEEGRKLYTEEINAAVRGAAAAGANEIVAMDCHGAGGDGSFNSLVPDLLEPRCEWVVQNEWTEYTGFLEQGCDAAVLVAMHARAGSAEGVLSHTVSSTDWYNLYFNDVPVGETAINAALCGNWSCPVVFVSGDDATCKEATDLLGSRLTTVSVKRGLGRFSARHVPPVRARELIASGVESALSDLTGVAPYDPGQPCEIRVELATPDHAEKFRNRPGCELVDSRTVASRADDWWTAWRRLYL